MPRALDRPFAWNDLHCGYRRRRSRAKTFPSIARQRARMPKCRVVDPAFDWDEDQGRNAPGDAERDLRSCMCAASPCAIPALSNRRCAALCAGLSHPDVIDHMLSSASPRSSCCRSTLIATTQAALAQNGLKDFWGYNSIDFFALEPRYLSNGDVAEFQHMVRALHDAGIEVILDVVFNHTGEGDELGPTLSFRGIDNASYYRLEEDQAPLSRLHRLRQHAQLRASARAADGHGLLALLGRARCMSTASASTSAVESCAANITISRPSAPLFARIRQDPLLRKAKLIAEPWDLGPGGLSARALFRRAGANGTTGFRDNVRRFWRGDRRSAGRSGFAARRVQRCLRPCSTPARRERQFRHRP